MRADPPDSSRESSQDAPGLGCVIPTQTEKHISLLSSLFAFQVMRLPQNEGERGRENSFSSLLAEIPGNEWQPIYRSHGLFSLPNPITFEI